jgi:glycosyltransferase involved in cell wall biosynthesis
MIDIAALTSGKNTPSTRFRIRQHIKELYEYNINITEYIPLIDKYQPIPKYPSKWSNRYVLPIYGLWLLTKVATRFPGIWGSYQNQITWLSREFLPGYFTLEFLLKRPIVFDVDDAIWLTTPFGRSSIAAISKMSEAIIAGNQYLANWFSQYSEKIYIIPTAIDSSKFYRDSKIEHQKGFRIGWTGSSANLPYLEEIGTPLSQLIKEHPEITIAILADMKPEFRDIPENKIEFWKWSEENEIKFLQTIDVGLMPLPDNKWTRGKCAFKMLQYMACEIPVVVSPVGMNAEILDMGKIGFAACTHKDWYSALDHLIHNRKIGIDYGKKGVEIIKNYFDSKIIAEKLAKIFHQII